MADRYGHQSAFMYVHDDAGFTGISYLELQQMTHNIAYARKMASNVETAFY